MWRCYLWTYNVNLLQPAAGVLRDKHKATQSHTKATLSSATKADCKNPQSWGKINRNIPQALDISRLKAMWNSLGSFTKKRQQQDLTRDIASQSQKSGGNLPATSPKNMARAKALWNCFGSTTKGEISIHNLSVCFHTGDWTEYMGVETVLNYEHLNKQGNANSTSNFTDVRPYSINQSIHLWAIFFGFLS